MYFCTGILTQIMLFKREKNGRRWMLPIVVAACVVLLPAARVSAQDEAPTPEMRTGVSLSGGGALGFCHIGVLDALDSAGIKVDCITGCSFGSIIAVLYAAGYSPEEIYQILLKENVHHILSLYRPNFPFTSGVTDTKLLQKKLAKYLPHNSFDSLKIKFYCTVTDMDSNCVRYVGSGGNLVQYVIASFSIPLVFKPVCIDSIYYFDGGSHDMMPCRPLLAENCNRRIGVYPVLESPKKATKARFLWIRAYTNIFYQNILSNREYFTELISVDPGGHGILSFSKMAQLRERGYISAQAQLAEHENLYAPVPNLPPAEGVITEQVAPDTHQELDSSKNL